MVMWSFIQLRSSSLLQLIKLVSNEEVAWAVYTSIGDHSGSIYLATTYWSSSVTSYLLGDDR